MLAEVIFQYRTLIGKCDLGIGLEWDEIEQLTSIEAAFAPGSAERRGRKFRREATRMNALLRGDRIHDRVDLIEIGPGGVVVRNAPFIARGEQIEIQIDDGDTSFRFRARGVWLKDDGDDYKVGLQLIGMPVCLRRAAVSEHRVDVVDEISAAAA